jgi:mycothiol system anti-sigma-R factor
VRGRSDEPEHQAHAIVMNCRHFRQMRFLFIDADLEDEVRMDFQQHWSRCPECARRAAFTLKMLSLLRARCDRTMAPAALKERIHVRLAQLDEDLF